MFIGREAELRFLNDKYNESYKTWARSLGWTGGVQSSAPYPVERVMLMSTYEEFMVILAVAMLIVVILDYRK